MISLVNAKKSFDGVRALDGVDLKVETGSLFGLMGPGGAGKSTLCKLVAGLVPPDSGVAFVNKVDLVRASRQAIGELQSHISMQFQNDALFEHKSVIENITYPLERMGDESPSEARMRAMERLAMVGLAGFEKRLPAELSGGQRRRVALARACISNPVLLICDEPTAGLDPVTSRQILDMIVGIQYQLRNTVMIVCSDVLGLLATVRRAALMWQGRILVEGSPAQLWQNKGPEISRFLKDARMPMGVNTWQ